MKKTRETCKTKYIIDDDLEIVPCVEIKAVDDPNSFFPKTIVGLRPEWVDNKSFTCSSRKRVSPFDLFDTYAEADRKVLDKKIEKLQNAFIVERDRWSKTCKYLSIALYCFAGLEALAFFINLFTKYAR